MHDGSVQLDGGMHVYPILADFGMRPQEAVAFVLGDAVISKKILRTRRIHLGDA